MLFLITQRHSPENCPRDIGGRGALHADPKNIKGLRVIAAYSAFPEHVLHWVVETSDYGVLEKLLSPGLKRCTTKITPVAKFM